ncbi:hypothetical protein H2203_000071 [Taxawa tesnikishii (nom. ined.)]|nr:hypothetical protein H2203_000071 [Dothideales sp. JES 119]
MTDQTSSTEQPTWAKALLATPSILTRRGLAWGYAEPTEESSVLVLTAKSSSYVDIRFANEGDPTSPENPDFWAFAGTCDMSLVPGLACTAHGKWSHPIDSMGLFDNVDEGDMFLLDNGDAIEIGTLENPKTGKVELYKEYWTSPTPEPRTASPAVVAKTEDGGKGMIVRVGDYCQGLYQSADKKQFWVERWTRDGAEGKWTKDKRSNTAEQDEVDLPSVWAANDSRKEGDETQAKGRTWRVVEVHKE